MLVIHVRWDDTRVISAPPTIEALEAMQALVTDWFHDRKVPIGTVALSVATMKIGRWRRVLEKEAQREAV